MSTEIDPKDFFGESSLNFDDDTPSVESSSPEPIINNQFAGFEKCFNLPIGSTKDAINKSKQFVAQTKALTAQSDLLSLEEQSFDSINGEDINDEVLRQDRARIRKEAHDLYMMGKNMLVYMYDQLKTTVSPNDKMWASVANMITSVTNSLSNLNKMTQDFRKENDKDTEKKIQSGEIMEGDTQEYELTPDKINKIIAMYTEENERKIQEEVKALADSRPAMLADQSAEKAKKANEVTNG